MRFNTFNDIHLYSKQYAKIGTHVRLKVLTDYIFKCDKKWPISYLVKLHNQSFNCHISGIISIFIFIGLVKLFQLSTFFMFMS